jgi:zinc protease
MENVFPYRHPYAGDVIGTPEDLRAATVEDVKSFFRQYYAPNNASLVIAGDLDISQARRLVEKYFAGIAPGPAVERAAKWIPPLPGPKVVERRERVPQERTYLAWPAPGFFDPEDAELELAALILTGGLSTRLDKTLVHEQRLCTAIGARPLPLELAGVFLLWATARPGISLAEIERTISAEISRLAREGPAPEEMARAKAKWEYQFVSGLEASGGGSGRADRLNEYNLFLGDPGKFAADLERHRSATPAGLRAAVARWLDTPNRVTVRFRTEPAPRAAQVALDRSQEPPLGGDRPFKAPLIGTARLDNGLEVYVLERRELPLVAVTFCTRAGSIDDTPQRAGLASLLTATLSMGTRTRNALEIDRALGGLGTSLNPLPGAAMSATWFQALKNNLGPALAILADVVRNPSFPAEEFDIEKRRRLDALAREESDPVTLGLRLTPVLAFGPSHPYGTPANGLRQTVQKLTRDDLERFHQAYWKPGSSALVFAGDVTLDEAVAFAKSHFGDWRGVARPTPVIPSPQPAGLGKVFLVDRPGAVQTMIVQVLPAPPRQSGDYYALALANVAWGGAATSRLNANLRERKGYTYGAWSYLQLYSNAGSWQAYAPVQTDKTKEALVEFVKELEDLAGAEPLSAEELAGVKANLIRGYAQRFELLKRVSNQIGYLWSRGMAMAEMQREPDRLDQTTLEQVNAVARKYALPRNSMLLLVGDRAKIEDGVRGVVKNELVVLDADGHPVLK